MPPLDDSYSFRSIPRRPPQVPHVSFPPSTCHFYYKRFRVVIGLRLVLQPYPRLQPVNDFCSSGQRFALGLVGSPNPASFRFHLTMDTLAFGYVLPTTGRTPDLHRLETCAAGRTRKKESAEISAGPFCLIVRSSSKWCLFQCHFSSEALLPRLFFRTPSSAVLLLRFFFCRLTKRTLSRNNDAPLPASYPLPSSVGSANFSPPHLTSW